MEEEKEMKPLHPSRGTIITHGKVSYKESSQAWSIVQIKKEIIHEFPQLREKRGKFAYKMVLHRNFKELAKSIREMEKRGDSVPLLLFLGRV